MDLTDPVATALLVADALARSGHAYALFGGLALAAYGEPRETHDADLAVIDLSAADAHESFAAAGIAGTVAFDGMAFGGRRLGRVTRLPGGGRTGLNVVDLVRPRSERYGRAALGRAIDATLREQPIRVLSPEDFVVFKVLATRERDLEDAVTVLRRTRDVLDMPAIDTECGLLAREIPDHDVAARWSAVQQRVAEEARGADRTE